MVWPAPVTSLHGRKPEQWTLGATSRSSSAALGGQPGHLSCDPWSIRGASAGIPNSSMSHRPSWPPGGRTEQLAPWGRAQPSQHPERALNAGSEPGGPASAVGPRDAVTVPGAGPGALGGVTKATTGQAPWPVLSEGGRPVAMHVPQGPEPRPGPDAEGQGPHRLALLLPPSRVPLNEIGRAHV